ncbi:MAG: FkbM family methyltransferase [Zoogloeaceae bacterium]|jgi:FkbM family methyltransferase|nr:FkbM family methyltransferase [Zoogloeaceae bacterium]
MGYTVTGFLDRNAQPGQTLDGLPVSTLEDWLTHNDPTRHTLMQALNSIHCWGELANLERRLLATGFPHILTTTWFSFFQRDALPDRHYTFFHDGTEALYRAAVEKIEAFDTLLADDSSHQWLESVVRFRLSGLASLLPPWHNQQYHPDDLPRWPNPLRFIDCGAYIGDTLNDLEKAGYDFEAIAAFDPNPENFRQLVKNSAHYRNIVRFPCALGETLDIVNFENFAMGERSRVADKIPGTVATGTFQTAQRVALDEVLPNFAPNLIKMDIEGSEPEALRGAREMIARYRPVLTISIYHEAAQLWEIPLMLQDWNLDYRFYIRGHSPFSADTVLYAIPASVLS